MTSWTASTSRGRRGRTDGSGTRLTLECPGVSRTDGTFTHAGRRLAYSSYGDGPRTTVLLHGLLFGRFMHDALARAHGVSRDRQDRFALDSHRKAVAAAAAGRFAGEEIAPLNTVGDRHGTPLKDGTVTMPPGWRQFARML